MAASIPVEMQQNLLKISAALKSIDEGVKELTNAEVNVEEFSKLEQARHHLTLCYVMCSEFWILLKINGIDTTEHPITQEMVRIKRYIDRMNEIERKDEKPSTRIDANAASRMIAHTADLDQVRVFVYNFALSNVQAFSSKFQFQDFQFSNSNLTYQCFKAAAYQFLPRSPNSLAQLLNHILLVLCMVRTEQKLKTMVFTLTLRKFDFS